MENATVGRKRNKLLDSTRNFKAVTQENKTFLVLDLTTFLRLSIQMERVHAHYQTEMAKKTKPLTPGKVKADILKL